MVVRNAEEQHHTTSGTEAKSRDFIRTIIDEHIRAQKYGGKVVTRFPPEPNGFLHIGHAKSICLNFGIAQEYPGGVCHLRFDDTDPTKEDVLYVNAIQEDVRWLGFDWGDKLFYASDYFERLYQYAVQLIQDGKAYVCSLSEQEIREYRGTVTQPGKNSPYRNRAIEENLDLFARMRAGEFEDGTHVLRAKIDMAAANMKMRDPLLYRIRRATHYRTGDAWCIYPLYDFAHCLSDYIEGITHSICTLEFENNRELYDWILDALNIPEPRPHQYEFARLNLNYTVMSKRKLLELVEQGHVSGWDDPRLHTISGLRRRGYTPESIRNFCESIGVAKSNSVVDIAQLEHSIRDDLNQKVPRVLCVLRPLRVVITNYPENQTEMLEAPYYPHDVPKEGSRELPFSRELYIEQDDFMENPPKDFFRLAPGREVRLRHAYIIRCNQVIKDDRTGEVVELQCTYFPETKSGAAGEDRKVKGTIHWVSAAHAVKAQVRLYDRLFLDENPDGEAASLNPNSLVVIPDALLEPSLAQAQPGSRYQFERLGYFYADVVDSTPGHVVFNRIVTLRDSWAKKSAGVLPPAPAKTASNLSAKTVRPVEPQTKASLPKLTLEQAAKAKHYQETMGLDVEAAQILAEDTALAAFFEAAVAAHNNPQGIANWIVNELLRVLKEKPIASLPVTPKTLAELVALIDDGTLSSKLAKTVFADMLQTGESPRAIVEKRGLTQITDPAQLQPIIAQVIADNPENVALYKAGKSTLFGFFVGQVLQKTGGRANPKLVHELVQEALSWL